MADKKRKLAQSQSSDGVEPDGKKAKREVKEKIKKDKHDVKGKTKKDKQRADNDKDDVGIKETQVNVEKENLKKGKDKDVKKEKEKEKKKKTQRKKEEEEGGGGRRTVSSTLDSRSSDANQHENMDIDARIDNTFGANDDPENSTKEGEKKQRKKKKKKKQKQKTGEDAPMAENTASTDAVEEPGAQPEKPARFIAFIGNLPFTATAESVSHHFRKNPPASVRVATEKDNPAKCRGFGFVEFTSFDRMKTCLKLYHHSSFDDGKSPARRINVELTAGGGGKSETRKSKIEAKNKKLDAERQQAAKQAQKANKGTGAGYADDDVVHDEFAGLHPSRRKRLPNV